MNRGKLLATVAILAMVFAATAIVLDNTQDSDAANSTTIPTNPTKDDVVDLESPITNGTTNINTNSETPITVTVKYNVTESNKVMFSGTILNVGKNVILILELNSSEVYTDCHIFVNCNVTVADGGEIVLRQDARAQGQSWYSDGKDDVLTLNGKLTIDGANGLSGIKAVINATGEFNVESTTSSKAAMNFNSITVKKGGALTISDSNVFAQLNTATINGNFDAKNSDIRISGETAKVTVNGTVNANSIMMMNGATKDAIIIKEDGSITADYVADSIATAIAMLGNDNVDSIELGEGTYTLDKDETIPQGKTLVLDGCIVNATNSARFIVDGELVSNGAYIFAGVEITEKGAFTSSNTHNNTVTGTMVDDYKVGFGDTLTITGTIPANVKVDAYGKLVLNDVTISGSVNTYVGSTVDVQGTVVVSSEFVINAGAEMELSGTITVKNDAKGGAEFILMEKSGDLESKLTITESGVLNINKPTANSALNNPNKLVVGTDAELIVEGTLNITGTLEGTVQDKGTVVFNGTSNNATIVLYDGVSITISSVAGTLRITDTGIVKDIIGDKYEASKTSEGNTVTIMNARNVTVSETVTTKMDKESTTKYYLCNMSVSGTVTKIQSATWGYVSIYGTEDAVKIDGKDVFGTMSIVDTLSIGKNVGVGTIGQVTVDGAVTAMESTNSGYFNNMGTLTVNGSVSGIQDNLSNDGTINAVSYAITTTTDNISTVIQHYTGFAAAVNAVGEADDDTVTVLGTVKMSEDAELAAKMTVNVSGKLVIEKGVKFTIADGASLSVTGTVDVDGTLIITNSDTGLTIGKLEYDISKINGKTVTYTSLANALSDAAEGDVITLAQGVEIEGSVTIPAGVTLQTGKYTITMKDNSTLAVDGTLTVQNGGNIVKETAAELTWGKDVKIVVNGAMSTVNDDIEDYLISGAYFQLKNVDYVSNLSYAAEKMDDGTITVRGTVSAGDVTFTEGENKDLKVVVENFSTNDKTVVSTGTITLNGATLSVINDTEEEEVGMATMSGKVSAKVGDSAATVTLSRASGVVIESATQTINANDVACMNLSGIVMGSVTVSDGTVTVASGATVNVADKDSLFTVASGATVDMKGTMNLKSNEDETVVASIEGTMDVSGTLNVSGIVKVPGTLNVVKATDDSYAKVVVTGTLNLTGTVNVSADEGKEGTFEVGATRNGGILAVGDKTSALGSAGTVVGEVDLIGTGYVKAYAGTTLTDAKLDWMNNESMAISTAYYINDSLYMTVYADTGASLSLVGDDSVLAEDMYGNAGLQIPGLDTKGINNLAKWFTDSEMSYVLENNTNKVGTEAIYAIADAAKVEGTISAGTGLDLYIDNVKWVGQTSLSVGEHTVSFDIKAGYDGSKAVITFNGQTITDGKIVITADMKDFSLVATGAVPANSSGSSGSGDMGITDYLLIILVVMVVILAIVVIMRMMRS